jgi:hypothetical protein
MKDIISLLILLPFLLFFMFQPFHNEIVHLRGMAMEATLDRGLTKAAIEGYFTPAIIQEMKDTLKSVGFNDAKIEVMGTIEGQNARVYRGAYIQGQIKYPMEDLWAMPGVLGNTSSTLYYVRSGTQMSEYLE